MENSGLTTPDIKYKTSQNPVIISVRRRNLRMHYVFDDELESLGTGNISASVNQTLFGVVFGSTLTLLVGILTGSFVNESTKNLFITLTVAFAFLSIFFAVKCYLDLRKNRQQIENIRKDRGVIH